MRAKFPTPTAPRTNVNTTPVSKETVTTTAAHVDYNYTSIETRTVTVNGEETVIVPARQPRRETPVEDETPDEVVTPETPSCRPCRTPPRTLRSCRLTRSCPLCRMHCRRPA